MSWNEPQKSEGGHKNEMIMIIMLRMMKLITMMMIKTALPIQNVYAVRREGTRP